MARKLSKEEAHRRALADCADQLRQLREEALRREADKVLVPSKSAHAYAESQEGHGPGLGPVKWIVR